MTGLAARAGAGVRVTEAPFQQQVLELAALCGYTLRYHTWSSLHSAAGFPDLVLLRPGAEPHPRPRLVFLELKSSRGQPTAEQTEWLESLMAAGCDARCYWPEQFAELADWLRE